MNFSGKKLYYFVAILVLAPVARELFFGIFSHHHLPFETVSDTIHTLSEVVFMAVLAGLLIGINNIFFRDKNKELRITQTVAIEALASLAEYRDAETSGHLLRMRDFSTVLTHALIADSPYSKYLSSQDEYVEDLANAAVLHDIGKIAVPDGILLKPAALSKEEFEIIKTHTTIGSEILLAANNQFQQRIGKQSYLSLAMSVARSHHEKWNGTGYPDGLSGEGIPLSARIVALCDVYDAVTSDRVYKKAWSHEEAVSLIKEEAGQHFDPIICEAFSRVEGEFSRIKQQSQDSLSSPLVKTTKK